MVAMRAWCGVLVACVLLACARPAAAATYDVTKYGASTDAADNSPAVAKALAAMFAAGEDGELYFPGDYHGYQLSQPIRLTADAVPAQHQQFTYTVDGTYGGLGATYLFYNSSVAPAIVVEGLRVHITHLTIVPSDTNSSYPAILANQAVVAIDTLTIERMGPNMSVALVSLVDCVNATVSSVEFEVAMHGIAVVGGRNITIFDQVFIAPDEETSLYGEVAVHIEAATDVTIRDCDFSGYTTSIRVRADEPTKADAAPMLTIKDTQFSGALSQAVDSNASVSIDSISMSGYPTLNGLLFTGESATLTLFNSTFDEMARAVAFTGAVFNMTHCHFYNIYSNAVVVAATHSTNIEANSFIHDNYYAFSTPVGSITHVSDNQCWGFNPGTTLHFSGGNGELRWTNNSACTRDRAPQMVQLA